MAIERIPSIPVSFCAMPAIDEEEKEIMARLRAYGEIPTGNKTTDRAMLRRIELQKAHTEPVATNKFLTVSQNEVQKIIDNKKKHKKEANPELYKDFKGAEALGQQVYLAIKMKNEKDKAKEKERKNNIKKT